MTESRAAEQASGRIRAAMERLRKDLPQLAAIVDAFEPLLAEQAAFKADLPSLKKEGLHLDPDSFAQGVPILAKNDFIISDDLLKKAAARLTPALEKGFPRIKDQLAVIKEAIESGAIKPEVCISMMSQGCEESLEEASSSLQMEPGIVKFVFARLVKPFAEKQAESLAPLPDNLVWSKGYCPICGSWPELSFLEGSEGRRWLKCSFCAHEWSFARIRCPFCETEQQDKMEMIFSKDRAFERAELCYECMKYVVSIDVRERIDVAREVAALGMVYLDVLAQEKGFEPGAVCGWNVIGGE
jgi:FdhE protein